MWKWQHSEQNPSGKSTASVVPQWRTTTKASDSNPDQATACMALSKNNAYLISASGGKVSLFNMVSFKVEALLIGHLKKITGLAFSERSNMLVSSGADAQLCIWSTRRWVKKKSRYLQTPVNWSSALVGDTRVQIHNHGVRILAVHESQLAIYDRELDRRASWSPRDAIHTSISSAVY